MHLKYCLPPQGPSPSFWLLVPWIPEACPTSIPNSLWLKFWTTAAKHTSQMIFLLDKKKKKFLLPYNKFRWWVSLKLPSFPNPYLHVTSYKNHPETEQLGMAKRQREITPLPSAGGNRGVYYGTRLCLTYRKCEPTHTSARTFCGSLIHSLNNFSVFKKYQKIRV